MIEMLKRAQKKAAWKTAADLGGSVNLMLAAAIGLGYVPASPAMTVFLHFAFWPSIAFAVACLFFLVAELTILGNPDRYQ